MKSAKEILTGSEKFHINLGLERITKILALLNNPEKNCGIIHVAGTNGKGSTSKIINDILIEHFSDKNIKIGLFTSPHLFSYTERIKINNVEIKVDIFDKLTNEINDLAKKNNIELSEFELITAVAFYYFYINDVKYAIFEVGLGGMYDATNVIDNPLVSVITTIDFDHTQRLGNTISEIAAQKAGIIKKNRPVAVNKNNLGYETIKKAALMNNSPLVDIPEVKIEFKDKNYAIFDNEKYEFNLFGSHQKDNLALALGAVKPFGVKKETLKKALKKVTWKFRLEYHKEKNILIDGAHNPSGIKTLRDFLDENFKNTKKTFIFGCLNNKDYVNMLKNLIKKEDAFYFYEFDYPGALKFNELPKGYNAQKLTDISQIKKIIDYDGLKIFCGSLYMLGNIFKEIEI